MCLALPVAHAFACLSLTLPLFLALSSLLAPDSFSCFNDHQILDDWILVNLIKPLPKGAHLFAVTGLPFDRLFGVGTPKEISDLLDHPATLNGARSLACAYVCL